MKIAYLSSSTLPSRAANSMHVMRMCQAFSRLGHEVTLVAPNKATAGDASEPGVHAFYGVESSFAIQKLPWRRVPGKGWIYGWEAARWSAEGSHDLAYCRNLRASWFAARRGMPTILELHSLNAFRDRLDGWILRDLLTSHRGVRVVVISEALRQALVSRVANMSVQVTVAHDAADPIAEGVTPLSPGGRAGQVQVGYVGHLYPGRGFELIKDMAGAAPWADFHVIGGTDDLIRHFSAQTSSVPNLRIHGFQPPHVAERMRLGCDILIAPYQAVVRTAGGGADTSAWMSPLKLFEYMAAGKPIVCSDIPVLREVLEHDKTALLVPPDSLEHWIAAFTRLRDDPGLAHRLAGNATARFLDQHTWLGRAQSVLSTCSQ